tara:strand:- start:597 stop:833 length:237 start_codon:yes stop_codon:yes gene_type:complete
MSVASAVYERTCHVCDAVRLFVMKTIIQMQRGRQLSANQKIMREMHFEYARDADFRFHLNEMNDRTNEEYDRKLKELH